MPPADLAEGPQRRRRAGHDVHPIEPSEAFEHRDDGRGRHGAQRREGHQGRQERHAAGAARLHLHGARVDAHGLHHERQELGHLRLKLGPHILADLLSDQGISWYFHVFSPQNQLVSHGCRPFNRGIEASSGPRLPPIRTGQGVLAIDILIQDVDDDAQRRVHLHCWSSIRLFRGRNRWFWSIFTECSTVLRRDSPVLTCFQKNLGSPNGAQRLQVVPELRDHEGHAAHGRRSPEEVLVELPVGEAAANPARQVLQGAAAQHGAPGGG